MKKMNDEDWDEAFWVACEELKDEVITAINQIRAGKTDDAIVTLERAFLPAWEDSAACDARYREVMGRGPAAQAQEAA